ncbi:Tim44/TimA family putative adaptor protein (plasmid) [Phyllobacterium sp. A18/5-2]|uniref:Tim44/TimA family putative adaptor protein n=1 Tax=Phyllobacterium sp. A18/5-2 TaxID=2978392 RepID=UPI0021C92B10|nr:Tim44/TimA family putative adaptor protein [Phyllobacterium sp. A18/5-2]UXN66115.1 Tim44/TimA family putative adaptor protein [Phyllobacterium sp. A18/5-2]
MEQGTGGYGLIQLILLGVVYWQFYNALFKQQQPPEQPDQGMHETMVASSATALVSSRISAADDIRWKDVTRPGSDAARGLSEITAIDHKFDVHRFLDHALVAYETILSAYTSGDRLVLQRLSSSDVYSTLEATLTEREVRKEHIESSLVRLEMPKIVDATVSEDAMQVTLRFICELVTVTRGVDNEIIDGHPTRVIRVSDVWTFARPIASSQRDWKLIATTQA